MLYDAIVIGGSAAGLTASLYTSRQRLKTLLVTKDIGGQMLLTNEIQNYPGFASIGGFELANKLKEQAESYGVEFAYEEAVELQEDPTCPDLCFRVRTTEKEYNSTAVILAFGKTPKDLGVPGEQMLKGKGVSYCAVCDGPLFRGKTVAVVGSGDQALEAANYLANVVSSVTLIHNYDRPIGSEDLVRQVLGLPNVKSLPNSRVAELRGTTRLERVVVASESGTNELRADGIFIEIGYVAKTDFLRGIVKLTPKNEVETDRDGNTSHEGIFAAGDVTNVTYKQAVISAAQGSIAALTAYNYIQRLRGKTATRSDWRSVEPVAKA